MLFYGKTVEDGKVFIGNFSPWNRARWPDLNFTWKEPYAPRPADQAGLVARGFLSGWADIALFIDYVNTHWPNEPQFTSRVIARIGTA